MDRLKKLGYSIHHKAQSELKKKQLALAHIKTGIFLKDEMHM